MHKLKIYNTNPLELSEHRLQRKMIYDSRKKYYHSSETFEQVIQKLKKQVKML